MTPSKNAIEEKNHPHDFFLFFLLKSIGFVLKKRQSNWLKEREYDRNVIFPFLFVSQAHTTLSGHFCLLLRLPSPPRYDANVADSEIPDIPS